MTKAENRKQIVIVYTNKYLQKSFNLVKNGRSGRRCSCTQSPPNQQQQKNQDHAGQQQEVVHLNWSNFKPEFSGKPDEDAEAHLRHSNNWMNAHHFVDGVKVQRSCLPLIGEARLWYQSSEPINAD